MTSYPSTNGAMNETNRGRLLGALLRRWRERLPPPGDAGPRRRTPGLRREELAQAAGISATWLTWLEQGRKVNASAAALSRIADALRLTPAERVSLFDLSGKRDPRVPAPSESPLPADLLALPSQFASPAYLLDSVWMARAWNAAAADLFSGWLDGASRELNLLAFVFLSAAAPLLIDDWDARARRLVAEFRADFNRRPNDPAMGALVERLAARSPLFAACWRDSDVLGREGGERRFRHPRRGELHFRQITLLVASRPELKLVLLTPR